MQFDQPTGGAWLKPADCEGHLILITKVHDMDPNHYDTLKEATVDKATFDYVDLDDPAQLLIERAQNTHPGIAGKFHAPLRTGKPVLGRIAKAPSSKGNPAWVLGPYDETGTDTARASTWMETHHQPALTQPTTTRTPVATTPPPVKRATPATAPVTPPPPHPPPPRTGAIDVSTLSEEQRAKLAALGIPF